MCVHVESRGHLKELSLSYSVDRTQVSGSVAGASSHWASHQPCICFYSLRPFCSAVMGVQACTTAFCGSMEF